MEVIIGIVIGVVLLLLILMYNRMKRYDIQVERAFGDLDAFLMKRVDQLDNLIQTARVATDKEMELVENVAGLRSRIVNATSIDEKVAAHINLQSELPMFYRTMEAYPEVKFHENYMLIQRSINEIEEQIQAARRNYNEHVRIYNTAITTFPSVIIAPLLGFKKKKMFEISPVQRQNVDVKELFNR